MVIRNLIKEDITFVVEIHQNYLKQGLIAQMGHNFLSSFYKTHLESNEIITKVAINKNGKVIGFITATKNPKIFKSIMIKRLWLKTIYSIINEPLLILKILHLPFYSGFKTKNNYGEILSIAVIPSYQGKGIGSNLIREITKDFFDLGVNGFTISVREKMKKANDFYKKIGLKKIAKKKFMGENFIFWEGQAESRG